MYSECAKQGLLIELISGSGFQPAPAVSQPHFKAERLLQQLDELEDLVEDIIIQELLNDPQSHLRSKKRMRTCIPARNWTTKSSLHTAPGGALIHATPKNTRIV